MCCLPLRWCWAYTNEILPVFDRRDERETPLSFQNYNIDPRCLSALKSQRITEPTPVQAEAIPAALEGRDVIAIAQTGTGKTLAFALPALTRLAAAKPGRNRMLVLTPTRELAVQVHSVLQSMGKTLGLTAVSVRPYGMIRRRSRRGVTTTLMTH